jgi:hypothetical protein
MARPPIYGTVTPPDDLQPAIDALGDKGRSYLKGLAQGDPITPEMLAKAADYERELNV